MLQDWTIYSWYCPNCNKEVCGIKDKKDQIKTKCERCGVHMVRKNIGRRHQQIDIYAPDYDESKGDVFYANLNPVIGSEQGGVRPVVILQNDIGNRYSPTTIVAPMTTQRKNYVPMHVKLKEDFLAKNSILLLEQIRTIDKRRLLSKMGSISQESQNQIDKVLDKNFYI